MRTIEYSSQFKRDYRKAKRNPKFRKLEGWLKPVIADLAADVSLSDPPYRDHKLSGVWVGYQELHIRPDLLLIYSKPDDETIRLVRIGSHSELFG
nr:type II toxin-antitoxin system YafQ family toxin [Oceanococcus sp. HetDA_MAG_MS8]